MHKDSVFFSEHFSHCSRAKCSLLYEAAQSAKCMAYHMVDSTNNPHQIAGAEGE